MHRIPFRLARAADPVGPASAALVEVEGDGAGPLADFLARLEPGRGATPFRVAGGFLVVLGPGREDPGPGPIRLRSPGGNLYLPVDAELVPPLLDDEVAALTRATGLVFLPGGRVLGFDPAEPVDPADLVAAARVPGPSGWQPFPDRPARVEVLREIHRDPPTSAAAAILAAPGEDPPAGGEANPDAGPEADAAGVGVEAPARPDARGVMASLAGRAALGMGQGLVRLGAMLGNVGLARLGARWAAEAAGRVPRLSETLFGRQEGAIRELLRQFRSGEVDRALRHALPLGGAEGPGSGMPARPSQATRLPARDPRYSLAALLGQGGWGPASAWLVADDLQDELRRAYLAAADAAEAAGDFRRAALIHGRLLGDLRRAAGLLERGGLFHDAAVLYRDRLQAPREAARCLEAAGATDQALRLLRDGRFHAEAGDLLRRLGDEDAAVAEYAEAAGQLATGMARDHLAAGDLLRTRAGRSDLALPYYADGWRCRLSSNAVPCLLRMVRLHADEAAGGAILERVGEAEAWFERMPSGAGASSFFNDIAAVAELPRLAAFRDELRDRALLGLAGQLRRGVEVGGRAGTLTSALLGSWSGWPPDVVADARHAVGSAGPAIARARPAPRRIRLEPFGRVAACGHAPGSGSLLLGFEGLDRAWIVRVEVETGAVQTLPADRIPPPRALSVSPEGDVVVALTGGRTLECRIWSFDARTGAWGVGPPIDVAADEGSPTDPDRPCFLTPIHRLGDQSIFGAGLGPGPLPIHQIRGCHSNVLTRLRIHGEGAWSACLSARPARDGWALVVAEDPHWILVGPSDTTLATYRPGWTPAEGSPVSWLAVDSRHLEVAGINDAGEACWTRLDLAGGEPCRTSKSRRGGEDRYQAGVMLSPGRVAAIRRSRVEWLRAGPPTFQLAGDADHDLASVVAGFSNDRTRELVIVGSDGTLACVPLPG